MSETYTIEIDAPMKLEAGDTVQVQIFRAGKLMFECATATIMPPDEPPALGVSVAETVESQDKIGG